MSVAAAPPHTATPRTVDVSGYNGPTTLEEQIKLAEFLALAELVIPKEYRGRAGDLLALIQHAQALNVPVTTAIHNLFFEDDGSGGMSAQLMGALLRRGGADWTIEFEPGRWFTLTFTFADGRTGGPAKYTIGDAMTAEVAGSQSWVRHPDDMLYARALSRGARRYAQDLLAGFGYVRGETRDQAPAAVDTPAADVAEEVVAFLSNLTADSTTGDIRDLIKKAKSKRVNLAGEYAGDGQTVLERLEAAWRIAAAREAGAREVDADEALATDAAPDVDRDGPPGVGGVDMDAPAGVGTLKCNCPSFAVIGGGEHLAGVCSGDID